MGAEIAALYAVSVHIVFMGAGFFCVGQGKHPNAQAKRQQKSDDLTESFHGNSSFGGINYIILKLLEEIYCKTEKILRKNPEDRLFDGILKSLRGSDQLIVAQWAFCRCRGVAGAAKKPLNR
jgi:hypothetical protein